MSGTVTRAFPTTLLEFQRTFPNEGACAVYLEGLRWPDGFVCPDCHVKGLPYRTRTRPTLFECRSCRHQASVTAGTVMHGTRTPLQAWFWAAYLVTAQTPGMSALQFQRQLGIARYETAFQMLHKLRAAMVRPDRDRIGGEYIVEADEAEVGGETRGEGRGVHHMATVVGAVEVRRGNPEEIRRKRKRQKHANGKPLSRRDVRRPVAPAPRAEPRLARAHHVRPGQRGARHYNLHGWLAGLRRAQEARLRPRAGP